MVAEGRALMAQPRLILMDEPSMGLAPALVETIYEIVRRSKSLGTGMLIVEQNATMALAVAARAYVLQTGEIVLQGSGHELLKSDSIRKAYLGGSTGLTCDGGINDESRPLLIRSPHGVLRLRRWEGRGIWTRHES